MREEEKKKKGKTYAYTSIPGRTTDCTVVNVLCNIFPVAPAALSRAVSFTN